MIPPIVATVSKPLPSSQPLATLDINPRVTSVAVETVLPGGYGACQLGMHELGWPYEADFIVGELREPPEVEDMCHVVVTCGGMRVHEGVLTRVTASGTGIESLGYGLAALNWAPYDSGTADSTSTGIIAREALAAVPWLVAGLIDDPGGKRLRSEFWQSSVSQVIDALRREGDGSVPYDLTVYEDRVTRYVARTAPAVADYRIPYDRRVMADLVWDYSEIVDAARARYTDSDGTARVTAWVYRDGAQITGTSAHDGMSATGDYLRRVTLSVSAEAASVMQFVSTYVAMHSQPALSGSVTYPAEHGLVQPSGQPRPAYLARAGEWVEIAGYGSAIITRTSADLFAGVATIELGPPSRRTFAGQMRAWMETAAATRSMTDVTTGNRRRA